jgi:hypothetical protein
MDSPLQTLEVRRVPFSADIEKPGDYCFIEKREPVRTFEPVATEPPQGFFRKLMSAFFGKKQGYKEILEIRWPEYDAIILNCPHCSQPIATTKEHRIVSIEPLTIEKPLACVYSRGALKTDLPTVAFQIKDGIIMPA